MSSDYSQSIPDRPTSERTETDPFDSEPVYSNRGHISYCRFLEKRFGKDVLNRVLEQAGVDWEALSDRNGYQPPSVLKRLRAAAREITGEEDLAYLAGRSLAENTGRLEGFIAGVTSPEVVIRQLGRIEGRMALKTVTTTESLGRRRYRVETHFKDGFREAPEACRNRIGCYEATPRFFGLPYAKVEHPECAFRGDPHCVYYVTLPEFRFVILRPLGWGSFPFILASAFIFFFTGGLHFWGYLTMALAIVGMGCLAAFKHLTAKKSLEWNQFLNDGLAKQNSDLEVALTQIRSLQDLTLSLGRSTQVQSIADHVVQTLVKQFGYGSSQLWMLDESGKWLACRSCTGYSRDITAYIRATRFEIGPDWDNPYGLLVRTLQHRQTLLVNEVEAALEKLTPRSRDFLSTLKMSSFIIR